MRRQDMLMRQMIDNETMTGWIKEITEEIADGLRIKDQAFKENK